MRSILIFTAVFLLAIQGDAGNTTHHTASGRVRDAVTGRPLAFVNIVINDGNTGGMTDIDGYFMLEHSSEIESLRFSYVGYDTGEAIPGGDNAWLSVELFPSVVELAEVVVVAGENPAHRIIENAIRERENNNPENIPSFAYSSYNKFIFSGEIDVDSGKGGPSAADSLAARISEYLSQRHFFMMETVTNRKYRYPGLNNETVIASRISGTDHPVFALFISQLQSFSFYDDYIHVLEDSYLSPLAPGSTLRYFYNLEDTTYTAANDSVFVISYRPSPGRNFKGLKGVMYINTNGWALQSVIAEPARGGEDSNVRIQQNYEIVDGDHWFPTQLNTDFEIFNLPEIHGFKITGTGRTYIQDIETELSLRRRDFSSYQLEFSPGTVTVDNGFWKDFRRDSLGSREFSTYHYLDSIAEVIDLDRRIGKIEALMAGMWRRGLFDLDITGFLRYNGHEGFRPGVSFTTNDRLSRRLQFRGLFGYGFEDREFKYGGGMSFLLSGYNDLRLGYDYVYDTSERGGSEFLSPAGVFSDAYLRSYYLETLDMAKSHKVWLQMRTLRNYLTLRAYAASEDHIHSDSYFYGQDPLPDPDLRSGSKFFETGLKLRLAFGENYIYTPERTFRIAGTSPVVMINIAKGVKDILEGDYDYLRIEANFKADYRIRMVGRQRFTLRGGYFRGEAPWTKRFTAPGAYSRFGLSVPGSFATMGADEFVSDRYIALFWNHSFEELLFGQAGFSPEIVLITNAGIGAFGDRNMHHNAGFETLEKGFIESGLAVLNLLGPGITSPGLEFVYRYGPYSRDGFRENFSLRLSYSFLF